MSLYRHVRPILSMRDPANTSHTGPVFVIIPSDTDPTPDYALGFRLLVQSERQSPLVVGAPPADPEPGEPTPELPGEPRIVVPTAPLPSTPSPVETEPTRTEEEGAEAGAATVWVETSADRQRWVPVHDPIDVEALPLLTAEIVLGPYVRARTVAEGDHQVDVHLLGTASYKLELA